MKLIIIVFLLIMTNAKVFSQTYRFDSIVLHNKNVINAKKSSKKVFITTTKKSRIRASNPIFSSSFKEIKELDLVNTLEESDYVFDFTIITPDKLTNSNNYAKTEVTIFDSKTGEFILTTGKFIGLEDEINLTDTKDNYFQTSLERCINSAVIPFIKIITKQTNDNPTIVRGVNHVERVVLIKNANYIEGFRKVKDIEVFLRKGENPEDIQDLLEEAMDKIRMTASISYSPVVLITDTYGLDGNEKVGLKGVCYSFK